jgi:dynein regulatry complex protein 1
MSKRKTDSKSDIPAVDLLGDIQIAESRGLLEQMERQTSEIITKIRTHSDRLEN